MEEIQRLLAHLKYTSPALWEEAITHSSAGCSKNNERLEYLGNAVLNMLVADALYRKFPDFDEHKLSLLCNYLHSDGVLARVSRELSLDGEMKVGASIKGRAGITDNMLAGMFEALAGTAHECGQDEIMADLLRRTVLTHDYIQEAMGLSDPITVLKEMEDKGITIIYRESERVVNKTKKYFCTVEVGQRAFSGYGNRKKEAKAMAALLALTDLNAV